MAKLLSCLKKRDLLHDEDPDPARLSGLGKVYLEEGRLADALDFFEKARDLEGIKAIRELSLDEGIPFLFQQASKILKEAPTPEAWERIGEKALSRGKFQEALTAYRFLQQEEKIQEILGTIQASKEHGQQ
jgi:tetratricopeptide (TPR) repeat protein